MCAFYRVRGAVIVLRVTIRLINNLFYTAATFDRNMGTMGQLLIPPPLTFRGIGPNTTPVGLTTLNDFLCQFTRFITALVFSTRRQRQAIAIAILSVHQSRHAGA